jgi:hypothetical protein
LRSWHSDDLEHLDSDDLVAMVATAKAVADERRKQAR